MGKFKKFAISLFDESSSALVIVLKYLVTHSTLDLRLSFPRVLGRAHPDCAQCPPNYLHVAFYTTSCIVAEEEM